MTTSAALTTPKSAGARSRVRRTSTTTFSTAMAPLPHATHAMPPTVRCVRLGEPPVTWLRRIGRPSGRWRFPTSPVAPWSGLRGDAVEWYQPKPRRMDPEGPSSQRLDCELLNQFRREAGASNDGSRQGGMKMGGRARGSVAVRGPPDSASEAHRAQPLRGRGRIPHPASTIRASVGELIECNVLHDVPRRARRSGRPLDPDTRVGQSTYQGNVARPDRTGHLLAGGACEPRVGGGRSEADPAQTGSRRTTAAL